MAPHTVGPRRGCHLLKERWCIQRQVAHRGINNNKVAREAAKVMGESPTKGLLTAFNPTAVMLMRVDTPRICNWMSDKSMPEARSETPTKYHCSNLVQIVEHDQNYEERGEQQYSRGHI
jgi:hypothetical protein